jgi:hypothetical protein
MKPSWPSAAAALILTLLCVDSIAAAEPQKLEGSFVVEGAEAALSHVRAARVELEPDMPGYAVLLSARPAEGDLTAWRSADPAEKGSFILLMLEPNGAIWIAELGHAAAKTGRFGVVTEVAASNFSVKGDRLQAHLATGGEQSFNEDRYTIDLQFETTLEK